MTEYNFFQSSLDSDRDLFFGPLSGETFLPMPPTMAHIMHIAGIFPSVNQARCCGWREIPDGFTDMYCGKNRTRVTIFKERT
jgi:hypothetical protein